MPTDFENALRNAEGNLSLARDEQTRYEALAKKWRDEVTICQRVLDRMREVVGIPLDAPILKPAPKVEFTDPFAGRHIAATPSMRDNASPGRDRTLDARGASLQAKEVVAAPASASFSEGAASSPQGANGFDRLAVKRLCREWHIAYPVKKSYLAGAAQFKRQALKSTLVAHPNYPKWLADGHIPIMSGMGVTFPVMHHCAKVLGVDARQIEIDATKLFNDVLIYGVPGIDHVEVEND